MKWFKFYGQDFLTDSKLGSLNPLQRLMWVTLLCIASQDENKTGVLKFLSETRLKELSGISDNPSYDDWERTDETLETFCNMGLVSRPDPDTIVITNFHKKQTQQSTSTERVKQWRDRNRAMEYQSVETNVTLQSNGRIDKSRIDKNRIDSTNTGVVPTQPVKTPKSSQFSKEGADVIKAFEVVDAKNKTYYGNKTQRECADFLIKEYGLPQVLKAVSLLKQSNQFDYCPVITSPYDLKEKWGKLATALQKVKNNQPILI